jgi:all-trans-nonaprenyl-diphosphate synthase
MEEHPSLAVLIEREFSEPDDLDQALGLVRQSQGIQRARALAESMARESTTNLKFLPASASRDALMELPDFVLSRLY